MHDAFAAFALATGLPTPSPEPTVDPQLVSPGPWGFLAIALLAVAVIVLVWDMMRRIRRGRVRADINEQLDAEERAAETGVGESDAAATDDRDATDGQGGAAGGPDDGPQRD